MADGTVTQFEFLPDGSFALRPPKYVDHIVLAANTQETFTVPTGAKMVNMAGTANFYVDYITTDGDLNSSGTSELVVNGAFASDTSWTKGTGWTIAAGKGTSSGAQTADADLEQSCASVNLSGLGLVRGRAYKTVFTVSGYTAGNVCVVVGGTEGTDRASNATFTETIIAGSTDVIALRADLDFIGSVDDFSVVPVATVPAADSIYGGGVELNPTLRIVSKVTQMSFVSAATCIISLAYYS